MGSVLDPNLLDDLCDNFPVRRKGCCVKLYLSFVEIDESGLFQFTLRDEIKILITGDRVFFEFF
jgi:hypothetical protein